MHFHSCFFTIVLFILYKTYPIKIFLTIINLYWNIYIYIRFLINACLTLFECILIEIYEEKQIKYWTKSFKRLIARIDCNNIVVVRNEDKLWNNNNTVFVFKCRYLFNSVKIFGILLSYHHNYRYQIILNNIYILLDTIRFKYESDKII